MNHETAKLRELFNYDETTGVLTNKVRRHTMPAGSRAGWSDVGCGYWRVRFGGKVILVHRLIFAWVHGRWPVGEIDHINGNPLDNRIENLREASHRQNCANRAGQRGNLAKGVYWHKGRRKWQASIFDGSKLRYLGLYEKRDEARTAYNVAGKAMHGEFFRESV